MIRHLCSHPHSIVGDSGGPLYDSVGKKLVGTISTGGDVCEGYPVVTTRLAFHVSNKTYSRCIRICILFNLTYFLIRISGYMIQFVNIVK